MEILILLHTYIILLLHTKEYKTITSSLITNNNNGLISIFEKKKHQKQWIEDGVEGWRLLRKLKYDEMGVVKCKW